MKNDSLYEKLKNVDYCGTSCIISIVKELQDDLEDIPKLEDRYKFIADAETILRDALEGCFVSFGWIGENRVAFFFNSKFLSEKFSDSADFITMPFSEFYDKYAAIKGLEVDQFTFNKTLGILAYTV